jgi:hypothetical protein
LKGHFFAAMNASHSLKLECRVVEEYKMITKRQRGFRWPWLAGISFSFLWRVEAPCKKIFRLMEWSEPAPSYSRDTWLVVRRRYTLLWSMITKCLNRTALQQLENQSNDFCSRSQLTEKAL